MAIAIEKELTPIDMRDMREEICEEVFRCLSLTADQQNFIGLIVGEAVTNAGKHALNHGKTACRVYNLGGGFVIFISNPSDGFCGKLPPSPDDPLEEHGRGLMMIKGLAADLCQSGLQAEADYFFHLIYGPDEGITVFRLLVCLP